jgi:PAS domain S-box-containing protein
MLPYLTSNWQGWIIPIAGLMLAVAGFVWALMLRARLARRAEEFLELQARERMAQTELERELRFRGWFKECPAPLLILSPEGVVLDANLAACQLHGCSLEQLQQEGAVPPDLRASLPEEIACLAVPGGGVLETLRIGAEGRLIPVELRGVPADFPGKRAILVHENDLSRGKRQEAALREGQERYRAMVEVLSEGVLLVDAEGRVATANLAAERILGRSASIVGTDIRHPGFEQVQPDGSPLAAEESPVVLTLEKGNPFRDVVIGIRSAHGEGIRWLSVITIPLKVNPAGRVLTVAMCFAEITEQVESQRELRVAKEVAESANRAKTEFMAHICHEIRTPLSGLTGAHDLLMNSVLTDEQRACVQTAVESVEDMLFLLNDLLDLARIEMGRLEIVRESFELRPMLEASMRPFRPGLRKLGVDLSLALDERLPAWVVTDPRRLRQVLTNLISNAAKFTASGSISIRVEPVGQHRARFIVTDTGIGIAREKLNLIFESFRQADATISRRFGGTGLGLAICRRLVGLMQGGIWVESEIGKGSRFYVEVPISAGEERESGLMPESGPKDALPVLPPPSEAQVLIVEDNPVNRQVTETMVQKLGLRTVVASNGRKALEHLQTGKFCLVLMDIQMPEIDGLTATRIWREREKVQGLPRTTIVALTAHALEADRLACLEAGMDDYLSKPLRREALSEMFARHLERRGSLPDPLANVSSGSVPASAASGRRTVGGLTPKMLMLLRGSNAEGLSRARNAVGARNGSEVARALHFVKGGCALLQDPELTLMLESLEADATAERWPELELGLAAAEARIRMATQRAESAR